MVHLQFYPDTPIGFYEVYHWSVQGAIEAATAILDENA